MIENLRKYTGLMMVILVIVFVGLLFLDPSVLRNLGVGGGGVLKIGGITYSEKEYRSLGRSSLELAGGLAGSGDYTLYQFMPLGLAMTAGKDNAEEQFFIARMILRQAKSEFGVYPADEEISAYLRSLKAFSGPDGKFSAENYRRFIDNFMGRLGMTERDLRELASDVLASQKIGDLVGSGLNVSRDSVASQLALHNQRISGEVAKLDLAPFEEKIQPTDEEIKTYWEGISDSFTTEPRRKFTYVIVTPGAVEEAKVESAPETIADAAASDEVKQAAAKKKEEEQAKRAADAAEQRRKKQAEADTLVDDFVYQLMEQKGAGFEELAKANGWDVKTTDFFAQGTPPKELDLALRTSTGGGKVATELFKIQETSDPLSKISPAIQVGENQWLVARLDGDEKSRAKEFAEARDEARVQYIAEKAAEAMKTAANEAVAKIKPLLAAGKSFTEAAKEAGINEVKEFTDITSTYRPDGATEPQNIFEAARGIDPGSIAEVIIESDRSFILHVTKREVVKDPAAAARIDSEVEMSSDQNKMIAYMSWINTRIEDGKVEQLYKKR